MLTNSSDTALVSDYLAWLSDVRGRAPLTVASYESTLHAWQAWLAQHGQTLGSATLEDVEAFMQRPRHKRGHGNTGAASTRKREIASLKGFYRWATARGRLASDPMLEAVAPTQPHRQPRPLSDAQWLKAWRTDMPNGLRTAIGLGFFCGLRRAEIVGLTVDQLTDRRIVDFVRKGGGEDNLPWRTLVEVYEAHLPHLEPERFLEALGQSRRVGEHLTPFYTPDALNRAVARAGLGFTPHQLRHSCATNLIRADVPLPIVSRMMNHTSINTTMLYVKAGGDELHSWLRTSRTTEAV